MRALLPLILMGTAGAVDVRIEDARTQGGPMLAEVASETQTTVIPAGGGPATANSTSHTDHLLALREGITLMRGRLGRYGGLVWGAGFSMSHYYYNSMEGHTRILNPALEGYLGYGYAFNSWLHCELGPMVGGGYSILTEEPASGAISNRSYLLEYGVRIGAFATINRSWQAGLEIPSLVGHARPKSASRDAAGNVTVITQDNYFRTNGAMLSLGMRF